MKFTFALMDESAASEIQRWRYEEPFAVYNPASEADPGDLAEMLERRSPYYAVRDEQGELAGFFSFGTSAIPWDNPLPGLYIEDRVVVIGLGLRPDLTGKGLGLAFVHAGLTFAREHFQPTGFRLFVLPFNKRAIRVYERAGFAQTRVLSVQNGQSARDFLEMYRSS